MREKVHANDIPGMLEAMREVESVSGDLLRRWSKANQMSGAILRAFGESED
jgi:hypothetical protein